MRRLDPAEFYRLVIKHWPRHQALPVPGTAYIVNVDQYVFHNVHDALALMEWRSHGPRRGIMTPPCDPRMVPCDAANDDYKGE